MKRIFPLCAALALLAACSQPLPNPEAFSVIPYPNEVSLSQGAFNVKGVSIAVDPALDEASQAAVQRFVSALETASGVKTKSGKALSFVLNANLAPEQYVIDIQPKAARVEASALNGFVYACETLKQMLPAAIYGSTVKADANWVLPCAHIEDQPRFAYRGMHLDPCRHFFTIEETKRYLDVMAAYKLNRFHWHLTEDQGWRMEVKAYPKLTEVGAWRNGTVIKKDWNSNDGIRYGGFYTQEQMKEIVAYAAERGITVIPEVDLPGHMVAALAAYPQLGCTGGPYEVWTRWGVAPDILCAGNEEIYTFLEAVLTELIDIFPSEYIHIGGDEAFNEEMGIPWDHCPKCAAKMKELGIKKGPMAKHYLQNYVTSRMQDFLNSKGRKIIGWDEILEGNLAPGATVMSWRGVSGGIEAAKKGFDAIMTPNSFMYFDYYQSEERDKEPFAIGGFLPVEDVYAYEPFEGLEESAQSHILGVQANLWTEYIATPEHLEYMLLPRMCALSEIQWCQAGKKDYYRFNQSLNHSFAMFDAMGLSYCMDVRGLVGLDRQPARTPRQLKQYLEENPRSW